MTGLDTKQTIPLALDSDGVIRISGSRVTLDSIVHEFQRGATAEQIQEVANLCFAPQRMGLGIVGPVEGSKVERWIGDIGY